MKNKCEKEKHGKVHQKIILYIWNSICINKKEKEVVKKIIRQGIKIQELMET